MIVNRLVLTIVVLTTLSAPAAALSAQQPDDTVALTVRLRTADGASVVDETVVLQRLPDEEDIAPLCKTDGQGACTWYVDRGLYQVLFERPLDEVSALALAEGGLRGFGLTVGEEAIAYHFTFHSDGHVYFDAAPDAAAPVPIIPTAEHIHGGAEEVPAPEATLMTTATAEPEMVAANGGTGNEGSDDTAPEPEESTAINDRWRVLILATTGLMAGSGLHWWTRRRERQSSNVDFRAESTVSKPIDQEEDDA